LHLGIFEQSEKNDFFSKLLGSSRVRTEGRRQPTISSPLGGKGQGEGSMMKLTTSLTLIQCFLVLIGFMISFASWAFSAGKIPTKVVVRVVSRDSKVVGSGVGGAFVRVKNLETGEILAQGKQEGGTGETDRIMVQPHRRGEVLFGTPGAAFYQAEIPLDKPTQVEIFAEAPLAYPHALQRGSKTITLIPGKHILGEGLIIELNGLIVNVLSPSLKEDLKRGGAVLVRAEIRML
jgi:hypothetical protein